MKKLILVLIGAIVGTAGVAYGATVFNSSQLAASAVSGYILQTNGTTNSWVANTATGFSTTSANYWKSVTTFTGATTTLLADNNTFSGSNVFSSPLTLSGVTGTTTIATGQGFTVGSTQLVVQQGSGFVGIGTNIPSKLLTIDINNTGQVDALNLTTTASSAGSQPSLVFSSIPGALSTARISSIPGAAFTNSALLFSVANSAKSLTERARIDVNGNLGIGTTSPWGLLSVQATANSAPPQFVVASTTAVSFLVNSSGNVGIGTTTPNTLLTIGGAGATGAANGLNFSGDTSGNLYRLQAGIIKSDGSIYSAANVGAGNSFYFYNSNLLMAATAAVAAAGNAYTFTDATGVNYRQIKSSSLYLASTSSATPYFVATINGAVGIGTSTPWGILSVVSSTTSAIPQLVVGSSTVTSMVVSNLGNVGIRNVNPATTLDVTGTLHTTGGIGLGLSPIATDLTVFTNSVNGPFGTRIYNQNTSGASASAFVQLNNSNFNTYMELQGSAVATSSYIMPNAFDFRNDGQGINFAATRADGFMSFWTGGSNERLRISETGNIGVASSTPWGLLSVQAPENSAVPQFIVGSSTATSLLVSNTGNVGIGSTTIPTSPLTLSVTDNNNIPSLLITDGTIKWGMWTGTGPSAQFGTQTNHPFAMVTNNTTVATFNTDKSVLFAGNPTVAAGAYLSTQGRTGGAANGDILYNSGTSQNLILAEISGGNYVFGAGTAGSIPSTVLSLNLGSAFVGIGTSTPGSILSINNVANFTSATSTLYSSLQIVNNLNVSGLSYFATSTFIGGIFLSATQPATSTATVLNWTATGPQVEYQIGTAAMTITIINATTSQAWGSRKLVWVCNPNATAGALTWGGVEWIGSAPTQDTAANECDVYSFDITRATSTTAYKVAGSQGTGFK